MAVALPLAAGGHRVRAEARQMERLAARRAQRAEELFGWRRR